ncbi:MAG TPA: SigE family RNA polymerase sigma factor [Marmoricola sp.]
MARTIDEDAFHDFVVSRSPALLRTAYLLTGDAHLAEDLVQTALFKTAKSWRRIRGNPEAYTRRVLYNENVSRWRRTRNQRETVLDEQTSETALRRDVTPADPDLAISLERALAELTPRQRALLVLRFYEDMTETQTAAALGISPSTVKTSTRQALARLRQIAPHLGELTEVRS